MMECFYCIRDFVFQIGLGLVLAVIGVKEVHKVSTLKAVIAVVIIPVIVFALVGFFIFGAFFSAFSEWLM